MNYQDVRTNPLSASSVNKSNVTLWKSKHNSNASMYNSSTDDARQIENEYIENLKKQVYFMEMELKLMREKEREIEKSGGISKEFLDNIYFNL